MARGALLVIACTALAACESVIGLSDLEFDRVEGGGGGSATSTGATPSTTGPGGEGGATSTSSTSTSTSSTSSTGTSTTSTSTGAGGGGGPSTAYRDVVLADGPIAYWRLGEEEGDIEAADEVGDHVGLYFSDPPGGTYGRGQPGAIAGDTDTAVTFADGGSVLVSDAAALRFPGRAPLSVELWIRFDSGGAAGHTPVFCQDADASRGWIVYLDANGFYFKRYGVDGDGVEASDGSPNGTIQNDGVDFHHVVITMGAEGAIDLYVDGTIAVIDHQTPIDIVDHDAPLVIGRERFVQGAPPITLDEVAIYDHPLSPDRVSLHHRCGRLGDCE